MAGFADELYRMIMEHKGATLSNLVGHAFTIPNYPIAYPHQQVLPHRPTPVPAHLVMRPPQSLIPSLSNSSFTSPVATHSPPRHMNSFSLSEFALSAPPLLPPINAAAAPSSTLPPFNDLPPLAPLKRHLDSLPQLPPLKRISKSPSPPPSHFALPPPPAMSAPVLAPPHAAREEENTRLHAAAEVLAGLLPTKPASSGITA